MKFNSMFDLHSKDQQEHPSDFCEQEEQFFFDVFYMLQGTKKLTC